MEGPSAGSCKLWGGRFDDKIDPVMERFNSSIQFDFRLCHVDLQVQISNHNSLLKNKYFA